jgi:hypothetical protein
LIDSDMSSDDQIRYLVKGTGFAGSSIDYLRNLVSRLRAVGIQDADLEDLLHKAEGRLIEAGARVTLWVKRQRGGRIVRKAALRDPPQREPLIGIELSESNH